MRLRRLCLRAKQAAFEVSVTSRIYSYWKVSEVWTAEGENVIQSDSVSVLRLRTGRRTQALSQHLEEKKNMKFTLRPQIRNMILLL